MIDDAEHQDVARKLADRRDLLIAAAQNLLDHHKAGRKCDPDGLRWARQIIKQNQPTTKEST